MNILRPYKLFKIHENSECENLMNLTRYLYSEGYDIRPFNIQERDFPYYIVKVPTAIFPNGMVLSGYPDFVNYYQKIFCINDLDSKMIEFTSQNGEYRIFDKSTHKNMVKVPLKISMCLWKI